MRQRIQLSVLKATECQRMERGGEFVVLINVKGTTGRTRKVNGGGRG